MGDNGISYQLGLAEQYKSEAVALYDDAFGKKFSLAIKDKEKRTRLFLKGLEPDYAISATSQERLLGVAGFHTAEGSLTGGITYRDLISQLGFVKGHWAALVFSLYERKPEVGELVMDGIAVRSDARGLGVGSALLDAICQYAKQHAYQRVRLDVIDTNPRAEKLYKRLGFKAAKTEHFPYLKSVLGFGGVTTMELWV